MKAAFGELALLHPGHPALETVLALSDTIVYSIELSACADVLEDAEQTCHWQDSDPFPTPPCYGFFCTLSSRIEFFQLGPPHPPRHV